MLSNLDAAKRHWRPPPRLSPSTANSPPSAPMPSSPSLAGLNNQGDTLSNLDAAKRRWRPPPRPSPSAANSPPSALMPSSPTSPSLGVHGSVLREMEKGPEAAAAFREGIACLKPLFLRLPGAFKPLMTGLAVDYIQGCGAAGVEADAGLLGDILPELSGEEGHAPPDES